MKPANVLIASDGRVVVTDFGIASAVGQMSEARGQASVGTAPQAPIGSPAYMSPEQVQGLEVDPRSDLYSLGVLIFEGLTGTLPFRGSSFLSLAAARLTQPIPDLTKLRPGLPVGLAAIVERCLARDPADRFDSASDVVIALDEMTAPSLRRTSTLRPPEPLPAAKSLAVLPFLNPGSKETDGIVESLWNDVIDALSTTQGLRVRPSSAVARFTGRRRNPVQAGREVSVDAVVDAMAYVDETGAHVVARLVSVVDGFQLWARRFSERSDDLLALSRRVAVGLSEALTLEPSAVSKRPSLDAETLDLYHRARRAQRTGFAIGFGKAVELYRELILRQPDDATILAGFATSSLWSWFYGAADSERCRTDAERALERALELAPDSLDVHIGRAQLLWNAGRARDAAVELRLTLRIGESLALHEMLGCLMREMGDFELARRALGKALRIDPESLLANLELARLSALEGDWEAADRFMARVTTPADPSLAAGRRRFTMRMALWRRDFEAVRAHVAGGEPTLSDLDQLYRLMARPDGQPLIQDFFNACDRKNTCTRAVAALRQLESEIACMVGDVEWALLAANRAFEAGLIDPMWLAKCPLLESMRSDPRGAKLQALMETRASEVRAVYDAVDRSPVSRRLDWVDEPEDSRS